MAQAFFQRLLGHIDTLTTNCQAGRRRSFAFRNRRLFLERLEDRRVLASFSDAGTELTIALGTNDDFAIVSSGTSYTFSSTQVMTNGGVADPSDFSAFGGTSVTLLSSGLARYSTISIVDASGASG